MTSETETEKQEKFSASPPGEIRVAAPREIRVVADSGPLANLLDTARFEHLFRIAEAMSLAPLIPDHLRGNKHGEYSQQQVKGNCFRIVNQAVRWGVDPFSIVDETYVAAGKLAYQGKVIAAVVNAKAPIKERLKYSYTGSKGKDDFTITVSGTFVGEREPREVTLSVGDAKTENQMWRKDPEQKLVYSGVIRWARRFTPELMLGVITEDDIERMEAQRAEDARPVRIERKVPKPDFEPAPPAADEKQPPLVDEETGAKFPPPPERKRTRLAPAGSSERAKDILSQKLGTDITRGNFLEGLKLIEFPDVPAEAEVISELTDITAQAILDEGVEKVFERIRDARWAKSMQ